jgi:DNA replication protein DnaC
MEVVPGKGARRCRCRTQGTQKKLLEAAHIPRRYEECSLSNYQPTANNGSQLRAFNYAYRLVREYPSVDRGLLFMGTCGIGKTHLSVAILRELMEKKGVSCLFYEFESLL